VDSHRPHPLPTVHRGTPVVSAATCGGSPNTVLTEAHHAHPRSHPHGRRVGPPTRPRPTRHTHPGCAQTVHPDPRAPGAVAVGAAHPHRPHEWRAASARHPPAARTPC